MKRFPAHDELGMCPGPKSCLSRTAYLMHPCKVSGMNFIQPIAHPLARCNDITPPEVPHCVT